MPKNMSKFVLLSTITVIVLLVTILIGGGYFSSNTPSPTPTPTPTPTPIPLPVNYNHEIVENSSAVVRYVGDVDGDGYNDIIAAFDTIGLYWYRYPNWDKHLISSFNWESNDLSCADIDNDGSLDTIGIQDSDGKLYWYDNSGSDTWTGYYIGTNNGLVRNIRFADFNRDGKMDVVTRTQTKTSVFLQVNSSSWNKIKTITHNFINTQTNTVNIDGLDVGDLDRDGDPDIVLNGFWIETPLDLANGTWTQYSIDSKWWNQNTGSWTDNNAKVFVADLNKDGRLDVVFSQNERRGFPVSWYETIDPKSSSWTEHIVGYVDYCHTLQVGDMNNDGHLDIVAGKFERHDGLIPSPFPLYVFVNYGNDYWVRQEVSNVGIYSGVIGDIGNDGILDIVGVRSYWKGPLEIWRGY